MQIDNELVANIKRIAFLMRMITTDGCYSTHCIFKKGDIVFTTDYPCICYHSMVHHTEQMAQYAKRKMYIT